LTKKKRGSKRPREEKESWRDLECRREQRKQPTQTQLAVQFRSESFHHGATKRRILVQMVVPNIEQGTSLVGGNEKVVAPQTAICQFLPDG
jgi:hypothetical protein